MSVCITFDTAPRDQQCNAIVTKFNQYREDSARCWATSKALALPQQRIISRAPVVEKARVYGLYARYVLSVYVVVYIHPQKRRNEETNAKNKEESNLVHAIL